MRMMQQCGVDVVCLMLEKVMMRATHYRLNTLHTHEGDQFVYKTEHGTDVI